MFVVCCLLFVVRGSLVFVFCLLCGVGCGRLSAVCVAFCAVFVFHRCICSLLFVVRCVLFVVLVLAVSCVLLVGRYVLAVVCCVLGTCLFVVVLVLVFAVCWLLCLVC